MDDKMEWRRSTRCEAGTCVEVANGDGGPVKMRDGKNRGGPVLTFTPGGWTQFLAGVRAGEFDPN